MGLHPVAAWLVFGCALLKAAPSSRRPGYRSQAPADRAVIFSSFRLLLEHVRYQEAGRVPNGWGMAELLMAPSCWGIFAEMAMGQ